MQSRTTERRVRAAYRARACAVSVAVGANVYAVGTGCGIPLLLNAAWLGALVCVPAAMLAAGRASRALSGRPRRLLPVSLTLIADAAFCCCALGAFAQDTLLPQARTMECVLFSFLAPAACALCGDTGVSRLCFTLRYALPGLLLALGLRAARDTGLIGVFPLLGAGVGPLCLGVLAALGAVCPALLLALPPGEIPAKGTEYPAPGAWFFAWRAGLGALSGVGMLLLLSLCSSWEGLAAKAQWGERMRIVSPSDPNENIGATLMALLIAQSMILSSASMLCGAGRALGAAYPVLKEKGAQGVCLALCAALTGAGVIAGIEIVAALGAALSVPAVILTLLAAGDRKKGSGGK